MTADSGNSYGVPEMGERVARLEQFLDKVASDIYPEPPSALHTQVTHQMIEHLVSQHGLPARARILDVGCGQGLALQAFAALGHDPVGITLGPEDLRACQQQGLTAHLMDESFLDFPDESFDLVWCRHALEHSVMPSFTLAGFVRVLKPGGLLFVEVPAPDTSCAHQTNPNHYSVLGRTMWLELLAQAGLEKLEALDLTFETGAGPDLYWAFFARKPAPALSPEQAELIVEARVAHGEELMGMDVPAALRVFEEVLAEHPTHVRALNDAGVAYFQMGRPDDACRTLETALGVEASANVVMNYFQVLLALDRRDAAAELLATRGAVLDSTDFTQLVRHLDKASLQAEGTSRTSATRRLPLRTDSLADILGVPVVLDIVDAGTDFLGDAPPYQALLEQGRARLVGLEPDADAFEILQEAPSPNETYLPYRLGDGQVHTLRTCAMPSMSSLLQPDFAVLGMTHLHGEWARIVGESQEQTRRLDDLAEIASMDYLKLAARGGELMILQGARERLARCLMVHTEVMFIPMYVDQPLFSEQEQYLRSLGFRLHTFYTPRGCHGPIFGQRLQPLLLEGDPHGPCNQAFWADAVFVRDLTRLEEADSSHLMKLALLMHDVYGSVDVALRCLAVHDQRFGTGHAPRYLEVISREK